MEASLYNIGLAKYQHNTQNSENVTFKTENATIDIVEVGIYDNAVGSGDSSSDDDDYCGGYMQDTDSKAGSNEPDVDTTNLNYKRSRKKHANSKTGCSMCKQRRIKCDETLPICSFCKKRNLQCSYLTMTPFQIHQLIESHIANKKSHLIEDDDFQFVNSALSKQQTPNTPLANIVPAPTSEFTYHPIRRINLDSSPIQTDNSMYSIHEMEGILLPSSMRSTFISDNKELKTYEYVPLRTNYLTSSPNIASTAASDAAKHEPLYINAKKSKKIFWVSSAKINAQLKENADASDKLYAALFSMDLSSIAKILNGRNLDTVLSIDYAQILILGQLYTKLLRQALLLLAMDYYKNTLMVQPILSWVNFRKKISISSRCEIESVKCIDGITGIIKYEYLPYFDQFSEGIINIFAGAFLVLNDCLGYHYKNGSKYEITYSESNSAVSNIGIFSIGIYSIVMEKSKQDLQISALGIIANHLAAAFKSLIIPPYITEIFDEYKKVLDKVANTYVNNVNYENLKLFCDKHTKLLRVHATKNTLLSFDNGYYIMIFNAFISIIPFDMRNLDYNNKERFAGRDAEIVMFIFYHTLGHLLNILMPSVYVAASNSFAGLGWNMFLIDDIKSLMEIFSLIQSKELKLVAVYLIRLCEFAKKRKAYYYKFLSGFTLNTLLDEENDLTINQRYLRLLQFKKDGIMDEIEVKSFSLNKGQFIQNWNYPNISKLKPPKGSKVSNNKIMNHFSNTDELIEDFIKSDNGFFSLDYDSTADLKTNPMEEKLVHIDGFAMKMLWKLVTYIRMNNL